MKHILLIIFTLCIISCEPDPPIEEEIKYCFFVAGHTYGAPGVDNVGFHPPFIDIFDYLNSNDNLHFGVLTGDMVIDATVKNFDEIDADVALINMPVYFVAGNHDVINRALYESRYGTTFYSWSNQFDLFIVLDPNIDSWNISGNQLDFLKTTLDANAPIYDNIFVFFHQVLWWGPDNQYQNVVMNNSLATGRDSLMNFYSEVMPLFEELDNNIVMYSGDVGAFATGDEFFYDEYSDNITFIASGMGGEDRDNIVITNITVSGAVSYELVALGPDGISSLGDLESYIVP